MIDKAWLKRVQKVHKDNGIRLLYRNRGGKEYVTLISMHRIRNSIKWSRGNVHTALRVHVSILFGDVHHTSGCNGRGSFEHTYRINPKR